MEHLSREEIAKAIQMLERLMAAYRELDASYKEIAASRLFPPDLDAFAKSEASSSNLSEMEVLHDILLKKYARLADR